MKRILIANRGEIALRAIRAIHKLKKEAVSIYSTADRDAVYLNFADGGVCVGGPRSNESYLNIPSIISAAEITECDAIFPGYGFLSENQTFVEICKAHNVAFIGPSLEVMELMADKSKAKEVMKKSGVPVIPGSAGAVKDVEAAKKVAAEIGYPVILKAASGGGGRGMRVVENESYIENAFLAASSEAQSAFGDPTIYMEKYIEKPRHVEVQILGDKHGNVIHLGERDCSLQRRHQKLIEESPAVILDEKTRNKLRETAVKAAKAIGYYSAGTIEFLVDKNLNFYFMEMNTRLQVEHPVSEMVSGIDLVEWMIRVEEGEKIPEQKDINIKGHSLECRILAEDPDKFIPNPGKIQKLYIPGGKDVRVDTHIYAGYIIPQYYDSLIAKVIVLGKDRSEAIEIMKEALREFQISGIKTTIPFHLKMLENEDFLNNNYDTKYLETKGLA
ncbi:acetyl-CoA carboxylase biotin carboxylase subunit [Lebetimonas sp. JH292]|uniref:acetyl-CoA carboxylase biotin carboxylase subunit n=1 Tax=Lebetimonas sp. JH292 TaxID=990068 RepID=UPI0004630B53|nr:acetyl-CoA carboxylase biotin carboxylase subunit [Lebetimonas sp. JH292]